MSFQPIINITNIPRDASGFVFTDITGNSPANPTGFGVANGPANRAAITSIWGEAQLYGAEPLHGGAVAGTLATTITVPVSILDGVQWLRAYYGEFISLSDPMVIDSTRLIVQCSDPDLVDKMEGVVALAPTANDFPARIKTIVGAYITLETPLAGTDVTYNDMFRFWSAQVRSLVLNCAESLIGNQIASLPNYRNDCEKGNKILDKILLKLNAQYAFNCGNFSEANASAQMICGATNSSTTNCTTCG